MALVSEELYSLLIPLRDERIIVPRSCVAEVVRYSVEEDGGGDGWQRDAVTWRDREVPVISFEALLGMEVPAVGGRTRLVIFNPLSAEDGCPPYGVLAQGFPQMVRVNSEVVHLDESYTAPGDAPVICQITMLSERALIPDLEALEAKVLDLVSSAA